MAATAAPAIPKILAVRPKTEFRNRVAGAGGGTCVGVAPSGAGAASGGSLVTSSILRRSRGPALLRRGRRESPLSCATLRIVVVDSYYRAFLTDHYAARPELNRTPYEDQLQSLLEQCFGTSDAYSRHLRELGHDAVERIVNCEPLQLSWALEYGRNRRLLRRVRDLLPGRAGDVFAR